MTADNSSAGEFRGASFMSEDFTGATFRDCDLRQVKVTDSWLVDVSLSGLVGNLVVNDVDVTAYVDGELDKRHPERVQLRAMRTASDYRAMWDTIENLWSRTRRWQRCWRYEAPAWRWCAASPTGLPMTTWNGNALACPDPATRTRRTRPAAA
jgi:uncharacterized protein YjbI with pentapeptide repeats